MIPVELMCPHCGGEPKGTLERTPGCALLNFDDKGVPAYSGETAMYWDGQMTEKDEVGRVLLLCANCAEEYPAPFGFEVP